MASYRYKFGIKLVANLNLRDIPEDIYQQIKAIAERDRRSIIDTPRCKQAGYALALNQQILILLEQALRQQKRPSPYVLERIDQQRDAIAARVEVMPNSADQIVEDRDR